MVGVRDVGCDMPLRHSFPVYKQDVKTKTRDGNLRLCGLAVKRKRATEIGCRYVCVKCAVLFCCGNEFLLHKISPFGM